MNYRTFCWSIAAALATVQAVSHAADLRIVPLVRDKTVAVSVDLPDSFTDEVREAIASGLQTTFTYEVELRMVVPIWVDRTVASAVITVSDHYDNLTRRHNLSRTVDGRLAEALVTENESLAKRWLTSLSGVAICPTSRLDPHRDYYVRIRASVRPPGSSLLGWANTISSQVKFTFIP
jgi:hypothetical protein